MARLILFSALALQAFAFAKEAPDAEITERQSRPWNVTGSYSLLDTWTLGKFGISGAWQMQERAWELNYQRGSFGLGVFVADIGKISEQRVQILTRSFGSRRSLNWFYGAFYNDVNVSIGNDILNNVSQGSYPDADLLILRTAGITWGLGQRWQRENGVGFGVDWFEINIPLTTLEQDVPILGSDAEEGDKRRIRNALDILENIPTATLLRVHVGYSF